jgi:DNA topoisomerase-1
VQLGPAPEGAAPAEEPEEKQEEEKTTKGGKKKKATKPKKKAAAKPKRAPVPRNMDVADIDLQKAIALLGLPREVGLHPESGEMIKAGIGRFGPFLVHQGKFKSIPADDPDGVLTIGLNRAVDLLSQQSRSRNGFGVVKELGNHPEDGKPVTISKGRFGPYVKHGTTNATLPKGAEIETLTLEKAVELLSEKKSAKKPRRKAKGN